MTMRNNPEAARGTISTYYKLINGSEPEIVAGEIVEEALARISVNGQELAAFMCSPTGLDDLAVGFLFNEGLIRRIEDVAALHVSERGCVDVWLKHDFRAPERKIITAGCGGVTFDDLSGEHPPLESDLAIPSIVLIDLMKRLQAGAQLYQRSRGIHTAVLAAGEDILLQVEDVGRHNCIDKLAGAALRNKIETHDRVLLSSGRISSEMLNKARRMGVPVVCSRTSPTSLSVALAETWNITIVAYLRGRRMRVYTHPERISNAGPQLDPSDEGK